MNRAPIGSLLYSQELSILGASDLKPEGEAHHIRIGFQGISLWFYVRYLLRLFRRAEGGETPVAIANTEAKPVAADGSPSGRE